MLTLFWHVMLLPWAMFTEMVHAIDKVNYDALQHSYAVVYRTTEDGICSVLVVSVDCISCEQ